MRLRILTALILANLLTAVALIGFAYVRGEEAVIHEADARLHTSAAAVPYILPVDYHDTAIAANSINKQDYEEIVQALSDYADPLDLTYLYTMVQDENGRVFFTATSRTAEENLQRTEEDDYYFQPYEHPPSELLQAFRSGKTRYATYRDEFGSFRSVFIPLRSTGGRKYVTAADVRLSGIEDLLHKFMRQIVLLSGGVLVAILLLETLFGTLLLAPLTRLGRIADSWAQAGADPQGSDAAELQRLARRRDDLGSLARTLTTLEQVVGRHHEIDLHGDQAAETEDARSLAATAGLALERFIRPGSDAQGGFLSLHPMSEQRALLLVFGETEGRGARALLRAERLSQWAREQDGTDPGGLMQTLNRTLCSEPGAPPIHLFLALYRQDAHTLSFAVADHPWPVLCHAGDHKISQLGSRGETAAGLDPEARYQVRQVRFGPGDLLLIPGPGLLDARNGAGYAYGYHRFMSAVARLPEPPQAAASHAVLTGHWSSFVQEREQPRDAGLVVLQATVSDGGQQH